VSWSGYGPPDSLSPVIHDMGLGHIAPRVVLPIGGRARIDSEAKTFSILKWAVS
jgi:muramoyltetrapeptide carboxypeptidase LdcA involved in peptidoglycan recycling